MNKREDIDKLFRDALQDHESSPNPEIWDKITKQLDEDPNVVPMASARRSRMAWAKYAAAACLLIGVTVGYFALRNDSIPANPSLSHQDTKESGQRKVVADVAPTTGGDRPTIQKDIVEVDPILPETKNILTASRTAEQEPRIQEERQEKIRPFEEELMVVENIEYATIEAETELQFAHIAKEPQEPTFISVTEADPIRPMIEPFEEEDHMIAGAVRKTTRTIVSGLLNTVSDNITNIARKEVKVSTDDEGTLRVDFGNILARNKNKRRR